jgi:hypothetical protein
MEDNDILFRFLSPKACRFVRKARREWMFYLRGYKAQEGCLKRDAIRFRLEKLAYARYAKTLDNPVA